MENRTKAWAILTDKPAPNANDVHAVDAPILTAVALSATTPLSLTATAAQHVLHLMQNFPEPSYIGF
jgi:hypothetical protein